MGWLLEHLNFVLPVDRLFETPRLVAFRHPKPAYPVHVLIVPKKDVRDLLDLASVDDEFYIGFWRDFRECVGKLVAELNLEKLGYRLIVNGGAYQDVPVLHFHLVSEMAIEVQGNE